MPFQSTVSLSQGFGVVGELYLDSPTRSNPAVLDSADAAYNVIGRAFSYKSDGGNTVNAPIVEAGGSNFYGILACPKNYASVGTAANGTLAPTLTLRNDEVAQFVSMGDLIVSLQAASSIGALVTYNTTTGLLGSITPLASFTGVIAVTTGVLTVSSLAAGGYVGIGTVLSGTGVPGGTVITAQLSGTAGLAGTYQTNIVTAVASTAMTVPNSALASGAGYAFVPNAKVSHFDTSGSGLAVITLTN